MNWKKINVLVIFMLLSISNFLTAQAPPKYYYLNELLPPSDWLNEWKWTADPQYYEPDNLFEYINGSADLYLSYDFKALVTITFINENDQSLVVDIYDMRTPLNAFGAYSHFRSPESNYQPLGTEAIISEYYIRFYQGQFIVDLNASDTDEALTDFMKKVAEEISERIHAPKEPPEILNLLPPKHLIDKTAKYLSRGLLGHEFFPRGLEANYQLDAAEVKAFIVVCDSADISEKAFTLFSRYIIEQGENFKQIEIGDQSAISGKMPYHEYMLAAKWDRFIYGVIDLPKPESGFGLMGDLQNQIELIMKTGQFKF